MDISNNIERINGNYSKEEYLSDIRIVLRNLNWELRVHRKRLDIQAELKPCPFCGSNEIKKNIDSINNICWFLCDNCNAAANSGSTVNAARQKWNQRIQPKETKNDT